MPNLGANNTEYITWTEMKKSFVEEFDQVLACDTYPGSGDETGSGDDGKSGGVGEGILRAVSRANLPLTYLRPSSAPSGPSAAHRYRRWTP